MRMFALTLPFLLAAGCSASDEAKPSGVSGNRSFAATGFDTVSLRGPDDVIVRVGGQPSVTATGDSGLLERLTVEVVGSELRIGREKTGLGWSSSKGAATVTVTMPAIKGASVAGSGNMDIDAVAGPNFQGSVAGSGELKIATLKTETITLDIAGSGDAKIAGTTGRAKYSVAGSGDIEAAGLSARDADISVAGSGNVAAGVTGNATISLVGSGDADITGGAKCSISKIGSGEVKCKP